jgi:acetyl esterase
VTTAALDAQVGALLSPVPGGSPRPPGPPVRAVRDLELPLPGRTLPARLYRGDLDDCLVVFFHGGGFVTGDLDSHDAQARDLCRTTGRPVLSVAYRLAEDHPFPAAYDDAVAAVGWAGAHLADRVAVAGPSAGANLALGAALALAGTAAAPVAQLLAYPLVSGDPSYPSRTEAGQGYGLTSEAIEWCLGRYLRDPAERHDPRAAPLLSPHLASAPPAVVLGAGLDPLRDEARALAERLRAAAVPVHYFEEPTLPHGFWKFAPLADAARAAATRMGKAFRALLDAAVDRERSDRGGERRGVPPRRAVTGLQQPGALEEQVREHLPCEAHPAVDLHAAPPVAGGGVVGEHLGGGDGLRKPADLRVVGGERRDQDRGACQVDPGQ